MNFFHCKTLRNYTWYGALTAVAATAALDANAQLNPADVEQLVEYAQCMRANGYAEFPDPGPDGRMQLRVDPASGGRFQTAQRACTDKLPSGMAAMNAPPTPERLETLVKFAECLRSAGVSEFPDPSPQGAFELGSTLNIETPQVQQAMQACRESTKVAGLMFRKTKP